MGTNWRAAAACAMAFTLGLASAPIAARTLSSDEQVMFLPSTARWVDDGRLELRIEAWVYEIERRAGLTTAFADQLGLDLDAMDAADRARFYARTQLFRVDSESGKDLVLDFDAQPMVTLPRTDRAGRVRTRVTMEHASANAMSLPFQLRMPPGDPRGFSGRALIVPANGLSVVSDIDDTIKHSHVRDRRELMLNTFAREFTAVPGMAERYQALAAQAVAVHYVSSGPIQLYPPLAAFLIDAGFPPGSVHLRDSTSLQNVVPTHAISYAHKLSTIRTLLDDFPGRQFVLIGDSGEADPEIYGQLAREQPARIVAIHIRDVSGDARASDRYRGAFDGVAEARWSLFTEPPAFLPTP